MYDVVVVGSRVAGASTAMLLAGKGLRVLVVDRASFPSDTLSTHQVQLPGGARLRRWGLLDKVVASGAPPARQVSFDAGPVVLRGRYPAFEGVDAVYSPRRTVLDALLLEAAQAAGAEVRERFVVEELTGTDGRVTGIRGRHKGGRPLDERARLVVGADGKHSLVARTVGAAVHHDRPPLTMACYTYWQDVPLEGGELYARPRRAVGAWPTNDGLTMTYVGWPVEEFPAFRADVEGNVLRSLDLAGDLGERVRAGHRAERFRASPDLPNFLRRPYGPGWALVGDAGLVMDPITGQGIGDALRDAELLAEAVEAGLGGRRPLAAALAGYERARDRAALPMYEFTGELASFAPPRPEQQALFAALAGRQDEIDRFLAVLTGSVTLNDYFRPRNLLRVLGVRGMASVALRGRRRPAAVG
ncbi:MAG TPA: NAD(P)/FAD-dependent oxidoreductase [Actinomycetota bacterium]|jgi:2-polyprenyl-6-methoxyphenol hydroxylase-like FAD-dependent oxidoreductase|nr:NAD(P)/FAD-dependent oxidoreductase [Actinomycetota bacterium]